MTIKLKIVILMLLLLYIPISNVNALENAQQNTYIEKTFDDGSYIEITIEYDDLYTRSTTTKSKTATYKSENGTSLWSVTVKGTFTYDGSTSICTSSSVSTNNYSTSWKLSNAKSWKSGITANASVTAKQYHQDGTVLRTINKTVKLTCDKNGNLS
jgi:hypothetical protein